MSSRELGERVTRHHLGRLGQHLITPVTCRVKTVELGERVTRHPLIRLWQRHISSHLLHVDVKT